MTSRLIISDQDLYDALSQLEDGVSIQVIARHVSDFTRQKIIEKVIVWLENQPDTGG